MQSTKTRRLLTYFRPAVNGIVIAIFGFGIFFLFKALGNRDYERTQKKRAAEIQEMTKRVRFEVRHTVRTEPLNATLVLDTSMVPRSFRGKTRTLVAIDSAGRVVDSFNRNPLSFSIFRGIARTTGIKPQTAISISRLRVAVGSKETDYPLDKSRPPMLETSGSRICVDLTVRNENGVGVRKFTSRIDLLDSTAHLLRTNEGTFSVNLGLGPGDSLRQNYCQDFNGEEARTVRGFAFVPQHVQPINPNFPDE